MTRQRKTAIAMSFIVAAGNLGIIAISIAYAPDMAEFLDVLWGSLPIISVLLAGIVPIPIGIMLLMPVGGGKRFQGIAFVLSAIVFIVAAVQMSIALVLSAFWSWLLYKLYRSEG